MSRSTNAYRTKTIFNARNNHGLSSYWPVGIDVGYSAVKCFSPNMTAQFPSFAIKVDNIGTIGTLPGSYILYTDLETGENWLVGQAAQEELSSRSPNSSDAVLFGRDRYYNESFRVLLRTGLGISSRPSPLGSPEGKKMKIMTGLPPAYQEEDSPVLRSVFAGRHHFSLTIGNSKPAVFDFTLSEDDVNIVSQPFGTLYTVAFDNNGKIPESQKDFLSKNILIFDPGFGTFDLFSVKNHKLGATETFDDLGMKQVLKNTIDRIYREYGVHYTVAAFQSCLEKGTVTVSDRRKRISEEVPFEDILFEESEKVCQAAIDRTFDAFPLAEYDYLVLTGGTSAAWSDIIKSSLSGMKGLTIVDGRINDPSLPLTFANVRGYYYFLYVTLASRG